MGSREILTDIYHNTSGDKWANKGSWLSENRIGLWYGIKVDIGGHVQSITLNDNQLDGTLNFIPSKSFQYLHSLKELRLMSNSIFGSIPYSISHLISLVELNLSWNLLSGS